MKIGFLEEEENVFSMGRLLALLTMIVGSVVALSGTVAFLYLSCGTFNSEVVPQTIAVIGIGAGIIGSSEILKVAQRKIEI